MEIKKQNIDVLIKSCEEHLRKSGYSENCIARNLQKWKNGIRRYMVGKGITDYNPDTGIEYLRTVSMPAARSSMLNKVRPVHILDEYLESGTIRKRIVELKQYPLSGGIGEVAKLFLHSLTVLRRDEQTVEAHRRMLYYFISAMELKSKNRVEDITEQDVLDFINTANHDKNRHFTTIRLFSRFLYENKYVTRNLEYVLGKNHFPKREKLPSIYSSGEIMRMEASVDRTGAAGKRDYAIFLLASRLGLRNSDICSLQFSSLDWDVNIIRLTQQKTKRELELPLLAEVGESIINYLRYGRPVSGLSQFFLTANAPYQPLNRGTLSSIVARIMKDSGVDAKKRNLGPHVMRHSLASRLLKNGTSLPVISAVLGHAEIQTSMAYIRVDFVNLAKCALDVPIVNQAFYEQKGGVFYE